MEMRWSGCASEIHVDFYTAGDGDSSDFLDLGRCALQINVTFVDRHFKVVKCLGALTTGRLSGADAEVLVGEADGSSDLHIGVLGIAYQLVGHRLHGGQLVAREGDSGPLDILIFHTLLFCVFLSHIY